MPYQTFNDSISGDSDSNKKLAAMKLSATLITGKKCLDIGCNEGFFTKQFIDHGAVSAHGIDNMANVIESAKVRHINVQGLTFERADIHTWNTSDKYDIILISSALHYMNATHIISKLRSLLTEKGVFIYEGGIIMDRADEEWVHVKRPVGDIVIHPTLPAFISLCKTYFTRVEFIGASFNQPGDNVSRYVYYCYI